MPPWGTHGIFHETEIGHIVPFLKTLKALATLKIALDDPDRRSIPVETRDNPDQSGGLDGRRESAGAVENVGGNGRFLRLLPCQSGSGVQDLGGQDTKK